jgi:hypothetical protein
VNLSAGVVFALSLATLPAGAAEPRRDAGSSAAVAAEVGSKAGAATAADAGTIPSAPIEKAQADLDAALADLNPDIRGEALHALGVTRLPGAKAKLVAALEEQDGKIRFGAARGLTQLADPTTTPLVVSTFREEKGWAVKKELAAAAAVLGARELIPDLQKATLDPSKELAVAAAFALSDLKDPTAKDVLVRLGNPERKSIHKNGTDRWSRKVLAGKKEGDATLAALTLAQAGVKGDLPLLARHLGDADRRTRLWASAGVLRLTGFAPPPGAMGPDAGR